LNVTTVHGSHNREVGDWIDFFSSKIIENNRLLCRSPVSSDPEKSRGASPAPDQQLLAPNPRQHENLEDSHLRIRGLTRNVTRSHIEEIMSTFGPLESVELAIDPVVHLHKGFADVTFKHEEDGRRAKEYMHEGQIDGASVSVVFKRNIGKKKRDRRQSPKKHPLLMPERRARSPSPYNRRRQRSPSPYNRRRQRSPSPYERRRQRSPSPYNRRQQRSPSPYNRRQQRSPSPYERRRQRSPSPYERKRRTSRSYSQSPSRSPSRSTYSRSRSPSRSYTSHSSKSRGRSPVRS